MRPARLSAAPVVGGLPLPGLPGATLPPGRSGLRRSVDRSAMVLVAHGSADPRAAATTRALARRIAAHRPGLTVRAAYLDHTSPTPDQTLRELDAVGCREAVVVPLLLTAAYHFRVDLPAVVAQARQDGLRLPVRVADPLGPVSGQVPPVLVAALRRRLAGAVGAVGAAGEVGSTGGNAGAAFDAVALVSAGTNDPVARGTVVETAGQLGAALGVPCQAAYASAAEPTPAQVVTGLRRAGARRVAVAAYFLATGRLYREAVAGAREAGAVLAAAPLAAAPELAELVLQRYDRARTGAPAGAG